MRSGPAQSKAGVTISDAVQSYVRDNTPAWMNTSCTEFIELAKPPAASTVNDFCPTV